MRKKYDRKGKDRMKIRDEVKKEKERESGKRRKDKRRMLSRENENDRG